MPLNTRNQEIVRDVVGLMQYYQSATLKEANTDIDAHQAFRSEDHRNAIGIARLIGEPLGHAEADLLIKEGLGDLILNTAGAFLSVVAQEEPTLQALIFPGAAKAVNEFLSASLLDYSALETLHNISQLNDHELKVIIQTWGEE